MADLSSILVIFLAVVSTWVQAATTPALRRAMHVKETHAIPRGWTLRERAPRNHLIELQIGVKQNNFAALERRLYEVSDPDHKRYGQHLSADEVNSLVRPSRQTWNLVHEWLEDNNAAPCGYSAAKDWITVRLSVESIERLLDTEYHTYEHRDGSRVMRTSKWSLPLHLHEHIDTIQPTTSFLSTRSAAFKKELAPRTWTPPAPIMDKRDGIYQLCNLSSVTPQCLEELYKTKDYRVQSANMNSVAFTNYLGQHVQRSDGQLFLAKFRPDDVDVARTFRQISIADGPGDCPLTTEELAKRMSQEANLDFQAIAGINPKTPIISYSTGGSPPFIPQESTNENNNEPYLVWVNWLLSQESIPPIISTSYSDSEWTVPEPYARRVCQQFAQVGARGTTLLFASGDHGVGSYGHCFDSHDNSTATFVTGFPAGCPYVTSVGATMHFGPEVAAYRQAYKSSDGVTHGNFSSGGGFSRYFSAPDYQKEATEKYVRNLEGKYKGLFNASGRGYPDISAQGLYFAYFNNATQRTISGTSASTPLIAGILGLVNDALFAAGKKPLGFLNPWLYKKGYRAFTDVVSGSAHGCGLDGFPAVEGWDPVTGLGTPDFPKLVRAADGKLD